MTLVGGCGPVSIFAGMSRDVLTTWLTNAQLALLQFQTGQLGESFTYTQGDGSKSVVYTRANIGNLVALIGQLQQATGVTCRTRRPINVLFR
jgi:hypothetical protein